MKPLRYYWYRVTGQTRRAGGVLAARTRKANKASLRDSGGTLSQPAFSASTATHSDGANVPVRVPTALVPRRSGGGE